MISSSTSLSPFWAICQVRDPICWTSDERRPHPRLVRTIRSSRADARSYLIYKKVPSDSGIELTGFRSKLRSDSALAVLPVRRLTSRLTPQTSAMAPTSRSAATSQRAPLLLHTERLTSSEFDRLQYTSTCKRRSASPAPSLSRFILIVVEAFGTTLRRTWRCDGIALLHDAQSRRVDVFEAIALDVHAGRRART